jgi:alcohol dehydrogenase
LSLSAKVRRKEGDMKAWRLERLGGKLSLKEIPTPQPRPGSVLVRIEASSLMSYLKSYVAGKLPFYNPPAREFTIGTNGVGIVEAVGQDVWHIKPGQRVVLSSHFVARENVEDPAQVLIGLTAGAGAEPVLADWPDGTLAEYALAPVATVTPADGLDHIEAAQLAAVTRCIIPYGGLLRGRLAAGETLVVTGATGAYGSAAVLLGVAMGAARIIAAGRNRTALEAVAGASGSRVSTVALTGDIQADATALRSATGGGAHMAFDMVGQARDPKRDACRPSQLAPWRQARADGQHDRRSAGPLYRAHAEQLGDHRPVHVSGLSLCAIARSAAQRAPQHRANPPARLPALGAAGSHGGCRHGGQSRIRGGAALEPDPERACPGLDPG